MADERVKFTIIFENLYGPNIPILMEALSACRMDLAETEGTIVHLELDDGKELQVADDPMVENEGRDQGA